MKVKRWILFIIFTTTSYASTTVNTHCTGLTSNHGRSNSVRSPHGLRSFPNLVYLQRTGDILTINIFGTFNFELYKEMERAIKVQPPGVNEFIINLQGVHHTDQSAMGGLVLLYLQAVENNLGFTITNAPPKLNPVLFGISGELDKSVPHRTFY